MVERLTTFVEGFRNDDFFAGNVVGQIGDPQGFEAAVLVRLPEPTSTDDLSTGAQLLWGNGDLGAVQPEGWAISIAQIDPDTWTLAFDVADVGGAIESVFIDFENVELPMAERSLFVHAFWNPTGGGDGDIGFWVNGVITGSATKALTPRPATTPPQIGSGVVIATDPPTEPRISIGGVAYRTGSLGNNNHGATVFERVQEVDDITQLPDGSFLWDNVWSARRRLPNLTRDGQVWNDLTDSVELVRNGNGGTLEVNGAKAHWWNQ
jgi:hypothetical protein